MITPFEKKVLRFMTLRDTPVSWSELRDQLSVSAGALTVVINSLKRQLMVRQDGTAYAPTSLAGEALKPNLRRAAFEGMGAW